MNERLQKLRCVKPLRVSDVDFVNAKMTGEVEGKQLTILFDLERFDLLPTSNAVYSAGDVIEVTADEAAALMGWFPNHFVMTGVVED